MKRKLHFLLAVGIGLTASVGWLHAEETPIWKETAKIPFMGNGRQAIFVYANGHPATISKTPGATKDNQVTITFSAGDHESITIAEGDTAVIFGGSKNGTVTTSNITMESGYVYGVFGGGYGVIGGESTATVTGETTVLVKGGTMHTLAAGGLHKAKSGHVAMTVEAGKVTSWLHPAGVEQGAVVSKENKYPEFSACPNTVDSTTLKVTGGTFWCLACGGGNGWATYVKGVNSDISNATITGGVFGNGSNGRSDNVIATIKGCKFIGDGIEIAAINRGIVNNISLSFDGCDFSKATNLHANLGGTYRWGYEYQSSDAKVEGVPGNIEFSFANCTNTPVMGISDGLESANVTLTGAKAFLDKFEYDNAKYHTEFTIGEGKTWAFNDGLTMASSVKLTETGTLKYNKSFEANVSTADELKAAVALGADVINLADATYDLDSETLTIKKGVVLQGTDTAKCIIKGAIGIESDLSDTIDVVISGVKFDYSPTSQKSNTRCTPVIEIHKGKVALQVNNCLVNNNTKGTADRSAADFKYLQNVFQMDSLAGGSMTIKNCEINLNAGCQIAVLTEAEKSTVLLQNTKIQTAKDEKGNPKGNSDIGIFPHNNGVVVTMDNSTIELMNHYGIYMWSGDNAGIDEKLIEDLKVYLKNKSAISAYGAIRVRYTKNTYISIASGSTLTGTTFNAKGGSNDFGTLVMQGNIGAIVDIEDSNIGTKFERSDAAPMTPILFNNSYGPEKGTIINLKGSTVIQTQSNEKAPYMVKYAQNPGSPVIFPDPDSLKTYVVVAEGAPVKFLDETGKDCIVIRDHADKSFRNAAVSVASAILFGETYVYNKTTYYDYYPVAKHGDVVLATDTTMAKALLSLNNAKMLFFTNTGNATDWEKYEIPDSIIIECKDGYLVTGEKAANAFANSVNDKAVFYLKQSEAEFTTVAVGNNRVKVSTSTAWNDVANANRSVEIAANATLTVNVAMPLDTVFMAEGAQLIANANVTAKAVQLTYGVKKTWKAFGFPYAIGKIIGLNGSTGVTTVASSADKGIWTASIKNAEPVFEVSSNNATPAASCIIAAHKDSTILVTSTTTGNALISLSSQPEPNAPVVTKADEVVNFKIVSNPNIYDIQLTQTAYVLSADGKTFDRVDNPTIKAFQSFVLADESTTSTLRSLRVDDTPTGNEIVPTDGYYVRTGKGTITIHTAEPVQVIVVDMLGRIYYNARVTDGAQIAVPAGIYAVNRQKVIVK